MAVEFTVAEKLKQIYDLQTIDSKIDEIEVLKGELPIEVSDLEDEIAGLSTRVSRLESQVHEMEREASQFHAQIKEAETLMTRYNAQLDNVKNNREYEALMKELEMQRLDIKLFERKIQTIGKDLENKQETLNGTQARMDAKNEELKTKRVELEQIIQKTEKEEEKLRKQSEKARKHIEERLIRAYDKIRSTYRNGLAVVTVSRNACGGCFNMIPPQMQLEIAMRKKIMACEHCGRILIDDFIADPELREAEKAKA
jgi:predicted  nucleic acid-binding Zn-ribbon protein